MLHRSCSRRRKNLCLEWVSIDMSREGTFDHLIREALRTEEQEQGPAPDVREALLVEAARQQANRLPIQESIPPLAQGLQDEAVGERGETVHWWESDRSLFEN